MSASAAQLDIADYRRPPRAMSRRLAFLIFHSQHPDVLTRLIRLARQMVAAKKEQGVAKPKIGMRAVWEVARWGIDCEPVTAGTKRPVLNNNLAPEYARWISENCADLSDVFNLRERE